ncbi:MAG: hypothetical protein ACRC6N_02720, partial [Plesiomonas sp.]|uniref:hypothetical protein n=1 Tax=Plesiomonas sp. TaxID=2486279 RepID=UPI003F3BDB1B
QVRVQKICINASFYDVKSRKGFIPSLEKKGPGLSVAGRLQRGDAHSLGAAVTAVFYIVISS